MAFMRKRESQMVIGIGSLATKRGSCLAVHVGKVSKPGWWVGCEIKRMGWLIVMVTMISMSGGCCHHHTYTYTLAYTHSTTSPVRAYSEHFGLKWDCIERILVTVVSMAPIDPILFLQFSHSYPSLIITTI